MDSLFTPLFAFGAGVLTILSPCVMPLVPIVLGSAAQRHRRGPLASAAGLVVSFTVTGFLLATFATSLPFGTEDVRWVGGIALLLIGLVLVLPFAQRIAERAAMPLAAWAGERQARLERFGLWGQAGIGALLGLIWSPYVGPTLGAATLLAARGEDLAQVAVTMLAFGLGIASVLAVVGLAARSLLDRWRGTLRSVGSRGKHALGALLASVALLILTGTDRRLEVLALDYAPQWFNNLSTTI